MTATNATGEDGGSRFHDVSDPQWKKIKASLEAVDVDADTVIAKTWLGNRWYHLRDALPLIAEHGNRSLHLLMGQGTTAPGAIFCNN